MFKWLFNWQLTDDDMCEFDVLIFLWLQCSDKAHGCKVVVALLAHSTNRAQDAEMAIQFLQGQKLRLS